MSRPKTYAAKLAQLEALLRVEPMTARAIAAKTKCCKLTAYQRIEALRARGARLYRLQVRDGATGPEATAYGIQP